MSDQHPESDGNWFREELARAKARNAMLPRHARPVVRLRREPEPTGCHCGHPGSGCICYPACTPAQSGEADA